MIKPVDEEPFAEVHLDKDMWCKVDHEDYDFAISHLWHGHPNSNGRKFYARRCTTVKGKQVQLYLHKEIMKRTGKRKPSKFHTMVDHKNGDSLDNRRENLRWATPKMNARNRKC